MNGDLSHSYDIKIATEYLSDEVIANQDLNYLELREKQKFKVYYDFGNGWIFNVIVSKIIDEYSNRKLSGKGYGIIDDLSDIFSGINIGFGYYGINDFDLEEINSNIDIIM